MKGPDARTDDPSGSEPEPATTRSREVVIALARMALAGALMTGLIPIFV